MTRQEGASYCAFKTDHGGQPGINAGLGRRGFPASGGFTRIRRADNGKSKAAPQG